MPVLAVCLSEAHAEALEERLTRYCLSKFVEQGHTLYREGANKFLKPDGAIKEDKGDDELGKRPETGGQALRSELWWYPAAGEALKEAVFLFLSCQGPARR